MVSAVWNKRVIAKSNKTIELEGNHYFPKESLAMEYFEDSSYASTCPWKGEASYLSINVNSHRNENAAWYYSNPKVAAKEIQDHVAFWKGVEITSTK